MAEDRDSATGRWPCRICGSREPGDGPGCGHCLGHASPPQERSIYQPPAHLAGSSAPGTSPAAAKMKIFMIAAAATMVLAVAISFAAGYVSGGVSLTIALILTAVFVVHRGYLRSLEGYDRDPQRTPARRGPVPPWKAYPREGRFSRFWETDAGHAYLYWWHNWYLKLPPEEGDRYRSENPPPLLWADIYSRNAFWNF